jgi:hypothetical protein
MILTNANLENGKILLDIRDRVSPYLGGSKEVLDIASDKVPEFLPRIASIYKDSDFTILRNERRRRREQELEELAESNNNIRIAYPADNLEQIYDLSIAFLTLHELADTKKPNEDYGLTDILKKVETSLKPDGKIIIIDYDLKWFNDVEGSKRQKGRKFSENVFTTNNEQFVLRNEGKDCIRNHTSIGLEDYAKICNNVGFKEIYSKSYEVNTPLGNKPKLFFYLGQK